MIIINKLGRWGMRIFIIFSLLMTSVYAFDEVSYFEKSPDNQLLCHIGQYSFKMISQKNENLYLLNNACQTFKAEKVGIIF